MSTPTEDEILSALLADQVRLESVIAAGQANSEQLRRYSDIQAITRNYVRSYQFDLPPLPRVAIAAAPAIDMLLNYCAVEVKTSLLSGSRLLYIEVAGNKIYAPEKQTPFTTYHYIFGRSLPNFRQVEASGHILVQFPIGDLVMKPDELQVRIDGQQVGDSYVGKVVLTTR